MADNPPRPPQPRVPTARPGAYTSVDARGEVVAPTEAIQGDEEQSVAITLNVIDGFRFGCGLILAGVGFGFALIVVVLLAVVVSAILGLPLPFSSAAP